MSYISACAAELKTFVYIRQCFTDGNLALHVIMPANARS